MQSRKASMHANRRFADRAAERGATEPRRATRWVEIGLLVVGVVGLGAIVREVGAAAVVESLGRVAWALPLLFVFPGLAGQTVEAFGWRYAFRRDVAPVHELFFIRLAGESLNMTTPTASVGGEGVKAWLLRDRARLRDVVPSLVVAKTSDALAQALFLALGIGLAWNIGHLDPRMFNGMIVLLAAEMVAVAGFIAVQTTGAVARGASLLGRLGLLRNGSPGKPTLHVDRSLAGYYRKRPGRFAATTACNLVALLLGTLETAILAHVLGTPADPGSMLVVTAIASGISFIGFAVPGQVAVREGAYVAAFVALGLDPATGLAVGLAKRILDLTWAGVGFVVLARYRRSAARR
jgi:hypothetical protein